MSDKRRQTFQKRERERAVLERRARKQEKKDARKLAAEAPPEHTDASDVPTGDDDLRPTAP